MSVIEINNMEFYAFHGCFPEERGIGTRFSVDLSMLVDTTIAQSSDNIDDTVNYLTAYQLVKAQMEIPSHLLEHVADRIANALLEGFDRIEHVSVKVSKLNPPLGGKMDSVSVTVDKNRPSI